MKRFFFPIVLFHHLHYHIPLIHHAECLCSECDVR
jgi:hypothetical protein